MERIREGLILVLYIALTATGIAWSYFLIRLAQALVEGLR